MDVHFTLPLSLSAQFFPPGNTFITKENQRGLYKYVELNASNSPNVVVPEKNKIKQEQYRN